MKFDLNRLKAERIAKGLTQAQLAKAIGLSTNAYWRKENGQRDIGIKEFLKILKVLGYSENKLPLFFKQDVDKREQKRGK
ncbi:helix-turn-helix transcriptional regulator [Lactobacillus intestinalis]|uniref:helix-turn-helix transcriptional regulator n=1 Tax=Lactobacillus intestinalis TaxID=151781 RepID=UPI0026F03EB9|nr:helix-turn-helix transcriptional regulator [Lactobacillus intestinalis]